MRRKGTYKKEKKKNGLLFVVERNICRQSPNFKICGIEETTFKKQKTANNENGKKQENAHEHFRFKKNVGQCHFCIRVLFNKFKSRE